MCTQSLPGPGGGGKQDYGDLPCISAFIDLLKSATSFEDIIMWIKMLKGKSFGTV